MTRSGGTPRISSTFVRVADQVVLGRIQYQDAIVDQLQHVLVARDHIHQIRLRGGLAGQGADHVIGFVAREFEDGNAVSLERAPDVGHLLHQFRRHLTAIGLVAVIFDFLKGLGLQVKFAYLGDRFRLGVPEGGGGNVKHRGQIFGREVLAQFSQHVDKDVSRCSGQAGLCGHAALARHGVVGTEDERHRIHEEDAAAISGSQLGRDRRRRAFHLGSRGFSSGGQGSSLAGRQL